MLRYKIFPLLLLIGLLSGCHSSNNECSIPLQNRFVHEVLQDLYLWYREIVPDIDYSRFTSPEQTLDFLIDHEQDRFSSITRADVFDSLYNEGQYLGFGLSYSIENDGTVWVRFIYHDSAAGRAGLQRGDRILSINGQTVEQISAAFGWSEVFGPAEEGHAVDLLLQKQDGSMVTVNLLKSLVDINTVLHRSIIESESGAIGYLLFNSFLNTSNAELAEVFAEFKAAGVDRLILDLRYNGGGSVAVATQLASYLYQPASSTTLFGRLQYNDKHSSSNRDYYFKTLFDGLALDELVVISTASTCSASEMIINGLRPFIKVSTVGSTSCGKPVGMNPFEFCDKVLLPVTFAVFNAANEGDYFDGIAADCAATDDLQHAFGSLQEPMLAEALYVSRNNSCSAKAAQGSRPASQTSDPIDTIQAIIGAY